MVQGNMMTEKYTSCAVKTKSLGLMSETSPSEIDLMTEEDLDNYDLSQENADAIIDIGMLNKGKMLKRQ